MVGKFLRHAHACTYTYSKGSKTGPRGDGCGFGICAMYACAQRTGTNCRLDVLYISGLGGGNGRYVLE